MVTTRHSTIGAISFRYFPANSVNFQARLLRRKAGGTTCRASAKLPELPRRIRLNSSHEMEPAAEASMKMSQFKR